jgi:hypothetical protein
MCAVKGQEWIGFPIDCAAGYFIENFGAVWGMGKVS